MEKRLYSLHIPKCGGLVLDVLAQVLNKHNVATYTAKNVLEYTSFSDYSFVSWHFATTFIDTENTDTACILRDPVDRAVSNFLWLTRIQVLRHRQGFYVQEGLSMLDRLKYYLFEDTFYTEHKNIQTKFLSSKVSQLAIDNYYQKLNPDTFTYEDDIEHFSNINRTRNWFLDDSTPSLEIAKATLDRCKIVGVVDDHESYISQILDWVKDNLELDLSEEFAEELKGIGIGTPLRPYYNYSYVLDSEQDKYYTTQSLKALLTQEEIDRIYADNSMDVELYEYAKAKLQ